VFHYLACEISLVLDIVKNLHLYFLTKSNLKFAQPLFTYIAPRLFCASAFPCLAKGCHSLNAAVWVMYTNGKGVSKDAKQAVYWYKKAAEQGYAGADTNTRLAYHLLIRLCHSHTSLQDYFAHLHFLVWLNWIKKAYEGGNARAKEALGAFELRKH
jgi:TPR repeat protein